MKSVKKTRVLESRSSSTEFAAEKESQILSGMLNPGAANRS
jgi:hypothetical protein